MCPDGQGTPPNGPNGALRSAAWPQSNAHLLTVNSYPKARSVPDAARFDANEGVRCPERIVLPRPLEVRPWSMNSACRLPGTGRYYVFVAVFFGHKCAPLVMCRLSALLTRLLQGMYWQAELQLATYIDDPLVAVVSCKFLLVLRPCFNPPSSAPSYLYFHSLCRLCIATKSEPWPGLPHWPM